MNEKLNEFIKNDRQNDVKHFNNYKKKILKYKQKNFYYTIYMFINNLFYFYFFVKLLGH